jgi:hypothetical protein
MRVDSNGELTPSLPMSGFLGIGLTHLSLNARNLPMSFDGNYLVGIWDFQAAKIGFEHPTLLPDLGLKLITVPDITSLNRLLE